MPTFLFYLATIFKRDLDADKMHTLYRYTVTDNRAKSSLFPLHTIQSVFNFVQITHCMTCKGNKLGFALLSVTMYLYRVRKSNSDLSSEYTDIVFIVLFLGVLFGAAARNTLAVQVDAVPLCLARLLSGSANGIVPTTVSRHVNVGINGSLT